MNNPPADLMGQIYIITNKSTGKQYVGQTKNYQWRTDRNAWVPYGYIERFRQHIRNTNNYEKFGRCRALNSAMKNTKLRTLQWIYLKSVPLNH